MHGAHPLTTVRPGATPAVGSAPVRRGKAIGWTLVLGLVAWALVGPRARQLRHALRARLGARPHARDAPRLRRLARPHAAPARHAGRRGPLRPRRPGLDRRHHRPGLRLPRRARLGHLPPGQRVDQPRRRRPGGGDRRSRAAPCSTSARAPTSTSPTWPSSSAPCSSRPGTGARARPSSRCSASPASSGPRRGCSRAPTSSGCGSAACATRGCGRWPPPRRCCGRSATSSSPATRCTRSPARATPRSACSAITGLDEVPGTVPRRLGRDPARARPLRRRRRRAAGARVPAERASPWAPSPG